MIMLKNDRQCKYTKKKIAEFQKELERLKRRYQSKKEYEFFSHGYVEHIAQLKDQIAEYEKIKRSPLPKLLRARDPHEISHQLVRLRIARGLTQAQLAVRTRCKQADISRLEQEDYQGYTVTLLRKVAATLDADVELNFLPITSGKVKTAAKHQ